MPCLNDDEDTMMSLINQPKLNSKKGGHQSDSSDSDYSPPPQIQLDAIEAYDEHLQAALIY